MILRCRNCTLPANFPNIQLDSDELCQYCHEYRLESAKADKKQAREQLEQTIKQVKHNTPEDDPYHCIVALSGGKDSSYMLLKLVIEWELRCLAITVDNGFLSEQSIINSKLLCEYVGVDALLFKPNFAYMKALYKTSLDAETTKKAVIKRASDLCTGCINLINSIMLKEALNRNVQMIAGGYIAGQVPKNSSVMPLNIKTLQQFAALKNKSSLSIPSAYRPTVADFNHYNHGQALTIINPFLAIEYNEKTILEELQVIGWQRPKDTGAHSSNCKINDLGILNHKKKYGFHPYEQEIAEQVRSGTLSREAALKKLNSSIDRINIEHIENILA